METRLRLRIPRVLVCALLVAAGVPWLSHGGVVAAAEGRGQGYWLVEVNGALHAFGTVGDYGGRASTELTWPTAGIAATPSGEGYWLVGTDGAVLPFGDARGFGSARGLPLTSPIVGMAATSTGKGYWLAASDGGIFSFGDARFHGSMGATKLNRPIVGMAATPTGAGYWLVASDGGMFAFGDARFHGSMGATKLNRPIVGMAATPTGAGYWLVASDGGMFAFGDARFFGSTGGLKLNSPVVGMAGTPTGEGYWMAASDGGVFAFGDAGFAGSAGARAPAHPIVGLAAPRRASGAGPAPGTPLGPGVAEDPPATNATVPPPEPLAPPPPPTPPPPPEPTVEPPPAPFDVGLIGDTGYNAAQVTAFTRVIGDMNRRALAFVVHDGDIWNSGNPCTDAGFQDVLATFNAVAHPLVYTPGDNEWTDCPNVSSSRALATIRGLFFPTDETLGRPTMTVTRQYPTYVENAQWTQGGVVFATLNEPGSGGSGGSLRAANLAWLDAAFDVAQFTGAPGVMIIMQDNPLDPSQSPVATRLRQRTVAFGKPVVVVHGDTHRFRIDHPWSDVPNFTRVETHGDTTSPSWVRAHIDPSSPGVFSFTTMRA